MKKIVLLFMLLYAGLLNGQNSSEIKFEGGEMYLAMYSVETNELISEKPVGKVHEITYDTFYKSYKIFYNYMNKYDTFMDFEFISSDKETGARLYKETESLKDQFVVYDQFLFDDAYWSYKDNVTGALVFVGHEIKKINGLKVVFGITINNFKKVDR